MCGPLARLKEEGVAHYGIGQPCAQCGGAKTGVHHIPFVILLALYAFSSLMNENRNILLIENKDIDSICDLFNSNIRMI
jgi:hypothetical protein